MTIRFLKLSLASPESIRSWTERILPNGKKVGKILKGDLIDYKNGLPIRDGLSCERIFGPMVSFTCSCGRFKCIETRGIHIVHDTFRIPRQASPMVTRQNKRWGETVNSEPLQTIEQNNNFVTHTSDNKQDRSSINLSTWREELGTVLPFPSVTPRDFITSSTDSMILKRIPYHVPFFFKDFSYLCDRFQYLYYIATKNLSSAYNEINYTSCFFFSRRNKIGEEMGYDPIQQYNTVFLPLRGQEQRLVLPVLSFIFNKGLIKNLLDVNDFLSSYSSRSEELLLRCKSTTLTLQNLNRLPGLACRFRLFLILRNNKIPPCKAMGWDLKKSIKYKPNRKKFFFVKFAFTTQTISKTLARFFYIQQVMVPLWVPQIVNSKNSRQNLFKPKISTFSSFTSAFCLEWNIKQSRVLLLALDGVKRGTGKNISVRRPYLIKMGSGRVFGSHPKNADVFGLTKGKIDIRRRMPFQIISHSLKQSNIYRQTNGVGPKPLYKYLFQIYTRFQFDLKVRYNDFINKKALVFSRNKIKKILETNKLNSLLTTAELSNSLLLDNSRHFVQRNWLYNYNHKGSFYTGMRPIKKQNNNVILDFFSQISASNFSFFRFAILNMYQANRSTVQFLNDKANWNWVPFFFLSGEYWKEEGFVYRFTPGPFLKKKDKTGQLGWKNPIKNPRQEIRKKHQALPVVSDYFSYFSPPNGGKAKLWGKTWQGKMGKMNVGPYVSYNDLILFPKRKSSHQFYAISEFNHNIKEKKTPKLQSIIENIKKPFLKKKQEPLTSLVSNSSFFPGGEKVKKIQNVGLPRPSRVYKFKTFPPEEIRYCPICEVELLPNSIRRYRLGYIEFVSPVAHIWYTATSIPLLLNLSKTLIEGIAACHEALSSGFPPVYKWSYNGSEPTSWTFQMQPLKLPINLLSINPLYLFKSHLCPVGPQINDLEDPFQIISKLSDQSKIRQSREYSMKNNYESNPTVANNHQFHSNSSWTTPLKKTLNTGKISRISFIISYNSNGNMIGFSPPTFYSEKKKNMRQSILHKGIFTLLPVIVKKYNSANILFRRKNNILLSPRSTFTHTILLNSQGKLRILETEYSEKSYIDIFSYGKKKEKEQPFVFLKSGFLYNNTWFKETIEKPNSLNQRLEERIPDNLSFSPGKETTKYFQENPYPSFQAENINLFDHSSPIPPLGQKENVAPPVLPLQPQQWGSMVEEGKETKWAKQWNKTWEGKLPSFGKNLQFDNNSNTTKTRWCDSNNIEPNYDTFLRKNETYSSTITDDYEKKREWLKLEGFYETNDEKQNGSNDDISSLSVPLVLPFLGKNPDNIEFKRSYYNYDERFVMDTLKFIVDFFSSPIFDSDQNSLQTKHYEKKNQQLQSSMPLTTNLFARSPFGLEGRWKRNAVLPTPLPIKWISRHVTSFLEPAKHENAEYQGRDSDSKQIWFFKNIQVPFPIRKKRKDLNLFPKVRFLTSRSGLHQSKNTIPWPEIDNTVRKSSDADMDRDKIIHDTDYQETDLNKIKTNENLLNQVLSYTRDTTTSYKNFPTLFKNGHASRKFNEKLENMSLETGKTPQVLSSMLLPLRYSTYYLENSTYYFQLEQKTRLEKTFLKNLFYRNKISRYNDMFSTDDYIILKKQPISINRNRLRRNLHINKVSFSVPVMTNFVSICRPFFYGLDSISSFCYSCSSFSKKDLPHLSAWALPPFLPQHTIFLGREKNLKFILLGGEAAGPKTICNINASIRPLMISSRGLFAVFASVYKILLLFIIASQIDNRYIDSYDEETNYTNKKQLVIKWNPKIKFDQVIKPLNLKIWFRLINKKNHALFRDKIRKWIFLEKTDNKTICSDWLNFIFTASFHIGIKEAELLVYPSSREGTNVLFQTSSNSLTKIQTWKDLIFQKPETWYQPYSAPISKLYRFTTSQCSSFIKLTPSLETKLLENINHNIRISNYKYNIQSAHIKSTISLLPSSHYIIKYCQKYHLTNKNNTIQLPKLNVWSRFMKHRIMHIKKHMYMNKVSKLGTMLPVISTRIFIANKHAAVHFTRRKKLCGSSFDTKKFFSFLPFGNKDIIFMNRKLVSYSPWLKPSLYTPSTVQFWRKNKIEKQSYHITFSQTTPAVTLQTKLKFLDRNKEFRVESKISRFCFSQLILHASPSKNVVCSVTQIFDKPNVLRFLNTVSTSLGLQLYDKIGITSRDKPSLYTNRQALMVVSDYFLDKARQKNKNRKLYLNNITPHSDKRIESIHKFTTQIEFFGSLKTYAKRNFLGDYSQAESFVYIVDINKEFREPVCLYRRYKQRMSAGKSSFAAFHAPFCLDKDKTSALTRGEEQTSNIAAKRPYHKDYIQNEYSYTDEQWPFVKQKTLFASIKKLLPMHETREKMLFIASFNSLAKCCLYPPVIPKSSLLGLIFKGAIVSSKNNKLRWSLSFSSVRGEKISSFQMVSKYSKPWQAKTIKDKKTCGSSFYTREKITFWQKESLPKTLENSTGDYWRWEGPAYRFRLFPLTEYILFSPNGRKNQAMGWDPKNTKPYDTHSTLYSNHKKIFKTLWNFQELPNKKVQVKPKIRNGIMHKNPYISYSNSDFRSQFIFNRIPILKSKKLNPEDISNWGERQKNNVLWIYKNKYSKNPLLMKSKIIKRRGLKRRRFSQNNPISFTELRLRYHKTLICSIYAMNRNPINQDMTEKKSFQATPVLNSIISLSSKVSCFCYFKNKFSWFFGRSTFGLGGEYGDKAVPTIVPLHVPSFQEETKLANQWGEMIAEGKQGYEQKLHYTPTINSSYVNNTEENNTTYDTSNGALTKEMSTYKPFFVGGFALFIAVKTGFHSSVSPTLSPLKKVGILESEVEQQMEPSSLQYQTSVLEKKGRDSLGIKRSVEPRSPLRPDHFSNANNISQSMRAKQKRNLPTFEQNHMTQSIPIFKGSHSTNYYACISQITTWGSDHASWILFLKYIRANIYKGDFLLPVYFNKTNFQMMPRTGSIMLEQLLSDLSFIPNQAKTTLSFNTYNAMKDNNFSQNESKNLSIDSRGSMQNSEKFYMRQLEEKKKNLSQNQEAKFENIKAGSSNSKLLKNTRRFVQRSWDKTSARKEFANLGIVSLLKNSAFIAKTSLTTNASVHHFNDTYKNNVPFFMGHHFSGLRGATPRGELQTSSFNAKIPMRKKASWNLKETFEDFTAGNTNHIFSSSSITSKKIVSIRPGELTISPRILVRKTNKTKGLVKSEFHDISEYDFNTFNNKKNTIHAYKIKKPIPHKRFGFYSLTENGPPKIKDFMAPFRGSSNSLLLEDPADVLSLLEKKGRPGIEQQTGPFPLQYRIAAREKMNHTKMLIAQSDKRKDQNWYRLNNFFEAWANPCYIMTTPHLIMTSNDMRILKFIYSLIISFQESSYSRVSSCSFSYTSKPQMRLSNIWVPPQSKMNFACSEKTGGAYNGIRSASPLRKILYAVGPKQKKQPFVYLCKKASALPQWEKNQRFEKPFLLSPIGMVPYFHPLLRENETIEQPSKRKRPQNKAQFFAIKKFVRAAEKKKDHKPLEYIRKGRPLLRLNFYFSNETIKIYNVLISPCESYPIATPVAPLHMRTSPLQYSPEQKRSSSNAVNSSREYWRGESPAYHFTQSEVMRGDPTYSNKYFLRETKGFQSYSAFSLPIKNAKFSQAKMVFSNRKFERSVPQLSKNPIIKPLKWYRGCWKETHWDNRIGQTVMTSDQNNLQKYVEKTKAWSENKIYPFLANTYQKQIQGEKLFIKLKEIGNYINLIKKKDTLFKTIILKMDSTLQPLISSKFAVSHSSHPAIIGWDQSFFRPCRSFYSRRNDEVGPNLQNLQTSKAMLLNQNFRINCAFPYYLTPSLYLERKDLEIFEISRDKKNKPKFRIMQKKQNLKNWNQSLKEEQATPVVSLHVPSFQEGTKLAKLKFFQLILHWDGTQKKFHRTERTMELLACWRFLSSVYHENDKLSNFAKNKKLDKTNESKNLVFNDVNNLNQNSGHPVLQFYQYRKNFMLKKMFKQRLRLAQSNIISKTKNLVLEYGHSPSLHRKCNLFLRQSILHASPPKIVFRSVHIGSQPNIFRRNRILPFFLVRPKTSAFLTHLPTDTLLKRRKINSFYYQTKFEFIAKKFDEKLTGFRLLTQDMNQRNPLSQNTLDFSKPIRRYALNSTKQNDFYSMGVESHSSNLSAVSRQIADSYYPDSRPLERFDTNDFVNSRNNSVIPYREEDLKVSKPYLFLLRKAKILEDYKKPDPIYLDTTSRYLSILSGGLSSPILTNENSLYPPFSSWFHPCQKGVITKESQKIVPIFKSGLSSYARRTRSSIPYKNSSFRFRLHLLFPSSQSWKAKSGFCFPRGKQNFNFAFPNSFYSLYGYTSKPQMHPSTITLGSEACKMNLAFPSHDGKYRAYNNKWLVSPLSAGPKKGQNSDTHFSVETSLLNSPYPRFLYKQLFGIFPAIPVVSLQPKLEFFHRVNDEKIQLILQPLWSIQGKNSYYKRAHIPLLSLPFYPIVWPRISTPHWGEKIMYSVGGKQNPYPKFILLGGETAKPITEPVNNFPPSGMIQKGDGTKWSRQWGGTQEEKKKTPAFNFTKSKENFASSRKNDVNTKIRRDNQYINNSIPSVNTFNSSNYNGQDFANTELYKTQRSSVNSSTTGKKKNSKQRKAVVSQKRRTSKYLSPSSLSVNPNRNLRKLRLHYLRNFRRLRFIEYLKATYIKPEWMILSLLPVLPPDLRPVIANPRGYITGDINTHYQNVIYRNNNIEKLLDTFWIPRKFYRKADNEKLKMFHYTLSYRPGNYNLYKTQGTIESNLKLKDYSTHQLKDLNDFYLPSRENKSKIFNSPYESSIYNGSTQNPFIRSEEHWRGEGPADHSTLDEAEFINSKLLMNYPGYTVPKSEVGMINYMEHGKTPSFYYPRNSEQTFQNDVSFIPLPSIESKIIRTQVLHDSKPLQEMQYSLQKAVDALIDNSQKLQSNVLLRKGRPLKSLSDNLKGKEGRFRQHLLGKRVDYSGRSVIVVGPDLKLYECGIPLIMALRLFQPFLILYLIYRFKIASLLATQLIQRKHPMVINLLKKFIETWPILLNRAPTLHRMNIQAFKIRLVQGKAILLHPLVCSSYNADFDGDQMGVHIPITQQARAESWKLLWSINNSIGIASRQPLFLPSQDMVIGNYYLTQDPLISIEQAASPHYEFSSWEQGFRVVKSLKSHISIGSDKPWRFNKINHYFLSIQEAYQYYLNTAYHFHVNTPIWFRSQASYDVSPQAKRWGEPQMIFETSEREKPIEISIDKSGNSIYIAKYYEKQLKRNRILAWHQHGFSLGVYPMKEETHNIISSFPSTALFQSVNISANNDFYAHPLFLEKRNTALSDVSFQTKQWSKNQQTSRIAEHNYLVQKEKNEPSRSEIVKRQKGQNFSDYNKKIQSLIHGTLFNRNLNPICLNQIIRSTFGRIEFYYEAFQVTTEND